MHNSNSSINSKSMQKEKAFYPQKGKGVQHQEQKKMVNASCRSCLRDFPIQRQCGNCSHALLRGHRNKGKMVGKLPQLTFPAPQPEITKKVTKQTLWKLGHLSGGCAAAPLSSVHMGASSASSNILLCRGVAPASPVPQQPPHPFCQFSTTVSLILSLSAQLVCSGILEEKQKLAPAGQQRNQVQRG